MLMHTRAGSTKVKNPFCKFVVPTFFFFRGFQQTWPPPSVERLWMHFPTFPLDVLLVATFAWKRSSSGYRLKSQHCVHLVADLRSSQELSVFCNMQAERLHVSFVGFFWPNHCNWFAWQRTKLAASKCKVWTLLGSILTFSW